MRGADAAVVKTLDPELLSGSIQAGQGMCYNAARTTFIELDQAQPAGCGAEVNGR